MGKDTLSQGIALVTREKTLSHRALHSTHGKRHSLTRHCTRHTGKDTLSQGIALGTREKTLSHKALHSAHGKRHSLRRHCTRRMGKDTLSQGIALGTWEKTPCDLAGHSAYGKPQDYYKVSLTCTMLAMSCGSMERGNRRILKRESETNAFCASNTFSDDDITYTANVVKDTCNGTMFALLRISPNKRYVLYRACVPSIGPLKALYTSPPGKTVHFGTNTTSLGSILETQQLRAKSNHSYFNHRL